MREFDSAARLGLTNEDILKQVQTLLDDTKGDLRQMLRKEMLLTILRFDDSHVDMLDLKIMNRAMRELRYAFKTFYSYRDRQKVSFFGSARTSPDDPNYHVARDFARVLVERGFMVITGGGDGIMGAAQEGAGRDHSFGLNIMLPFEQGANATIADDAKLVTFKYFFTRKLMFLKESHAAALFPGGFGTHDEGFELLTLLQTGKSHPLPIVCLQAPGCDYWERWYGFIRDQLLAKNLINQEDLSLFKILDSPVAAVEEIEAFYRVYHSSRFVRHDLVLRLRYPSIEEQIAALNAEFQDMLAGGSFIQRPAFPEEFDEAAA